jgi:predicted aminopeptidase
VIFFLVVRKWIADILLGGLLVAGSYHSDLLEYGLRMGAGQLQIVLSAQPVRQYLSDPGVPDSLKKNVHLIEDIKQFTVDSMGLYPSENYSTVYDQHGKPLLWVVTASEKFGLKPKLWKFPVVGKVSYKGFFRQEQAEWEARELEKAGYETKIRIVNAWSTLGWFRDPIMSSMLEDKPGEIANVIIHELSHGTIYVKNDAEYSENLANFIGDEGSYWYLRSRYGPDSKEYREFYEGNEDYRKFAHHFVTGAHQLDSLYKSPGFQALPLPEKSLRKDEMIRGIMNNLDTIQFYSPHPLLAKFKDGILPNNAFFIVFLQYNNQQDQFMEEYRRVAGGDMRKYIAYLREKFPR